MDRAVEPGTTPRTVLVAEDDQDIRELIDIILTSAGYRALLACSGQQALDLIRDHSPDLALLDVAMPGGLSGVDVTRALRDQPATRHLPVLLLSALAQERDMAIGLAAGANAYLVKPFDPSVLMERVRSLLPDA